MTTQKSLACARLIDAAWKVRSADYIGLKGRDEFNAAALHVRDLITSASLLLESEHHAPATFLAIAAFEETAKIKAGHSRSWSDSVSDVKRSKDPLFKHADKHKIALDPILLIGNRLAKTIGKSRVDEIFAGYADGSFSGLRERSLYFSRDSTGLKLPATQISPKEAMEHVLIAIEIFADYFYFMTAEVSIACDQLDILFASIAERYAAS
jgi:AbiV family abortive infection protein